MLMPRYSDTENHQSHASSTTVAAHTKMRLLSKVEQNMRQSQQQQQQQQQHNNQQHQSINKLIHTAATGNGLVGDVDELLMPMRHKIEPGDNSFGSNSSSKEAHCRPERNLWSRAEMLEMLNIMQQTNALDQLNDRNVKSEYVFRQIEDTMRSKGYVKKSSIQIWTKWKFLKSTYNTTTRHGNGIPKVVPEEVYRVLCRMLSEHSHNLSNSSSSMNGTNGGIGSECGNSMDSSNAELNKAASASGGGGDANDELEHPIFGFRLGLVKAEPLDTGYETNMNSSEQEMEEIGDSSSLQHVPQMEHTPFMVTVKNEPDVDLDMDGTNTPPPTAPTSPSPPPSANVSTLSTQFTPLRVASFASSSTPSHGVLQIERPASMMMNHNNKANLPGKLNRSMPLQSTSSINFVHPTSKLMLPRKQQLHRDLRLPREISLQPATAAGAAAMATRPLKAVPMRETGYSLRPERMIPDLEQSISPPQSPSPPMQQHHQQQQQPQSLPKYAPPPMPYPSTSRHAQQFGNEQLHPLRKRRLNLPQQSPVPVKLQRSSTLYSNKPHNSSSSSNLRLDDASPAAEESKAALKVQAEELQRRKQQQEELFKKELHELANGFRDAQKEMMEDFFQHQKQLSRREHEFQLRQDNLVMMALRKQTDALLNTARQLLQPLEQPQTQQEVVKEEEEQQQQEEEQQQSEQRETETNTSNQLEQSEQLEEDHRQHMELEGEAQEDEHDDAEDDAQYSDEEEEHMEDMQSEDGMQMMVAPTPSEVASS
ncbi:putative mediator of RNA polymerase II transcription subunit 12 [Drosophila sulfurigaster albostrigata]|uniref:putative mediator of RNA polymerase II transcription subunit 12 n=1 Tax=Drosophila sulfurigaster albostrigata TaxID=89887 RepID=UPI002D21B5EA|nr:putative mediator of RNA polymerase II transcription subunit 12 [Drosophila sulfurigaster albostrigata]XP_062126575.1 putative mediator of RNA polymerase II transcription subunit 12 [Drosophila sulfurigaster albostrigata]XP_062126576.1 putative mediator of RNA polymerase II transcription subunit 12 [Drosophila sulfurigaster albostrigata]XP_062126578.1 putative mediator of RNA polymerase II transcription subunit 12 [Drosophila sulfurigaster albostrigata]XP_062126579.1 putative mediator of RNA